MFCASIYVKTRRWSERAAHVDGFGRIMSEMFERYWRLLFTGLSFVAFGVGGLAMRVLVFPALNILVREHQLRVVLARHLIRLSFRCFVGLMRVFGLFQYDISGLERLERRGLLILANHPTLIDTILLMAFVKSADCIVKSKLWRNPFTHGPIRAAGYVCNDHGAGLIEDCIASVRSGSNLIIFPEGTRTPSDGSIRLKRGAANIAVRGPFNITPVIIRCTPRVLAKGDKWWRVPSRPVHFSIEVQEDINIRPFITETGSSGLAARRLSDHLQDYFIQEKIHHGIA